MRKKSHRLFLLLYGICFHSVIGQSVLKTIKRLPDSGVNAGYTATPGEDNDFSINPSYFIKNGNGTVTDTVTGLMWQQIDGGEMTIERARKYCDTLSLGGYTDWRLPYLIEAHSIINHQYTNPAMDVSIFPKTGAEYWWSAENQINDTTKIWVSNAGGGVGNHLKTETVSAGGTKKFHVRAVRSIYQPVFIAQRFTDIGKGCVIDELTGLTWRKQASTDSISWENALLYADSNTSSGYSDWRLPNSKELQSFADLKLFNPCFSKTIFQYVGRKFWTSTTLSNQTGSAWYLDNRFGITTYDLKIRKNYVFLVRGGAEPTASTTKISAEYKVWPNPFSDRIKIHSGLPKGSVHYQLCDQAGRILFAGHNPEEHDFSSLPAGVYILRALGHSNVAIRLVKSRN